MSVDTASGALSVVGKFSWPIGDQDECSLLVTPAVSFDFKSGLLWLDFGSDFGFSMALKLSDATVASSMKPKDPFFIQFESFYAGKGSGLFGKKFLRGVHPTVTQSGLCSDGCFQMDVATAVFKWRL